MSRDGSQALVAAATFLFGIVAGWGGYRLYATHALERLEEAYADARMARLGAWSDSRAAIPISSEDPSLGNADALVTVVIFGDPQDANTRRADATLMRVHESYSGSDVRIIWKNEPLPFHPGARLAAEAAQGVFALAGRSAFWHFHHATIDNPTDYLPETFAAWAKAAGLKECDLDRFTRGLESHEWAPKIDADLKVGADVGVRGTPTIYVNGALIPGGAQPFERIQRTLDEQIALARKKLLQGTPRAALYDVVSLENEKRWSHEADPAAEAKEVYAVPIDSAPAEGSEDALVTIVLFGDFASPETKMTSETLEQIRAVYDGQVRLVWRDSPMPEHERALPAAKLAREARREKGDAGFWQARDALFASAPRLEDADLARIGRDLKLDAAKVQQATQLTSFAKEIGEDRSLAATLNAEEPGSLFVNGLRVMRRAAFSELKALVDKELEKARALRAKGIRDVYAALTKDGKRSARRR